jgi:hypothetical protein
MVIKNTDFIVRVGGSEIVCPNRKEALRLAMDFERMTSGRKDGRHSPPPKEQERAMAEDALRILVDEGRTGIESALLATRLGLVGPRELGRIALAIKHFVEPEGIGSRQVFLSERLTPRGKRIWRRGPKIMQAIHILNSAAPEGAAHSAVSGSRS